MADQAGGADDRFIHERLDQGASSQEFRLLRLLPAANLADDIRCEVFHTSLDDCPDYEALSYVWGDPDVTLPIFVGKKRYDVTINLECTMRYIRLPDRDRIMWIDALCINQRDLLEKNHQVGQMRHIYVNAKQVLVWLGEEGDAKIALDFIQCLDEDDSNPGYFSDNSQEKWDACYKLFYQRPWWTRTWILQEVLHDTPVLVYIGTITIELEKLCAKFEIYSAKRNAREFVFLPRRTIKTHSKSRSSIFRLYMRAREVFDFSSAHQKQDLFHQPDSYSQVLHLWQLCLAPPILILCRRQQIREGIYCNLISLLHLSRAQLASDPRDKVFALLGIANDADRLSISIDYTCSKRALYTATTQQLLRVSLEALFAVESPDRSISLAHELPSWVPDFSTRNHVIAEAALLNFDDFSASPEGPDIMFSSRPYGDILILIGVYVAIVNGVYETEANSTSQTEDHRVVRLITYNADPALRYKLTTKNPRPLTRRKKVAPTPWNTSWGPYWVEVGDIIIVAKGSSFPLVLRRFRDYYLFVGVCWLIDSQIRERATFSAEDPGFSDIMRGSVWDEVGKSRQEEQFHIR